jgi:uncharacterized HAD superfamily protein
VRIAIDIDSTLHHYWDLFAGAAKRRFGIDLPYEDQFDWGISRLRPGQLAACVADTHGAEEILSAQPYPGAVEAVARWHAAGNFIQITSHRALSAHPATEEWLRRIELPFDELYCSDDKISRCVALAIDLLIDDSPLNLRRAIDHGIAGATIAHPWNLDVCEEEDVVRAHDWPELERRLAPLLFGRGSDGPAASRAGSLAADAAA